MLSTPFKSGISIVKFSIDSKYVITVSYDTNNDQIINLWDWMSGSEKSTCICLLFTIIIYRNKYYTLDEYIFF